MKLVKLLVALLVVSNLFVANIFAKDYGVGSVIENEFGYIEVPADSSYIKFTLPQGKYPKGSKVVLYAQTNVYCFVPGLEYQEPTPDKNPYKVAAEYSFTDKDIDNLAKEPTTFTTTLKFDIMCGGLRATIIEGEKKPQNNLVENDREQGSTESDKGEKLDVYSDGTTFNANPEIKQGTLSFLMPQGSYTLGDYVVVLKGGNVLENIIITKELMETLVNANVSYQTHIELSDVNELVFKISSYAYDIGEEVEVEDPNNNPGDIVDVNPGEPGGNSGALFGFLGFVVVVGGVCGYLILKKKKEETTNALAVRKANRSHRIEDNRIIDAETSEKE